VYFRLRMVALFIGEKLMREISRSNPKIFDTLLKKSSTYWQVVRKIRAFLRYPSASALWNLIKLSASYITHSERTWGLPAHVKIDVSPNCNLRCPVCPHGTMTKHERRRVGTEMNLERFCSIIDQLKGRTLFASLYNLGEPLLNRDIFKMIRYAENNRIGTYITSNLSLKISDKMIDDIFASGLTLLIVGIDGVSSGTYGKARRRGDWETVRENLVRVASRKRELGATFPFLQIQFFCYPGNLHEHDDVRRFASENFIDEVSFIPGNSTPWLLAQRPRPDLQAKKNAMRPACAWPYFSMLIMNDGRVLPCCKFRLDYHYGDDDSLDMGDTSISTLVEIYGAGPYRVARSLVSTPTKMRDMPTHFCKDCSVLCQN